MLRMMHWACLAITLLYAPIAAAIVDGGHTGSWYDPEHEGSGFLIEVLPDQRAVVYWYTYDESGAQQWFIGNGVVAGDSITVAELIRTSGTRFGDEFVAADVVLEVAGSASFHFDGCDRATVDFQVGEFSDQQNLIRLSAIAGRKCGQPPGADALNQTGSWFNVGRAGEGFNVEVLDEQRVLVTWFTYDPQGRQLWLIAVGHRAGVYIHVDQLLSTSGGRLSDAHNPADVVRTVWGSLELNLSCNDGRFGYDGVQPGFGAGSRALIRLSEIEGLRCAGKDYTPVTDIAQLHGRWRSDGFGHYADVGPQTLRFFQVTSQSCLEVLTAPTAALLPELDNFRISADATRMSTRQLDSVTDVEFVRVEQAPPVCASGITQFGSDIAASYAVFSSTFAELYAPFDLRGVDWAEIQAFGDARIATVDNDDALFQLFTQMLDPLGDLHVTINAAGRGYQSGRTSQFTTFLAQSGDPDVDRIINTIYLDSPAQSAINGAVAYGVIGGDIGYIELRTLSDLLPGANGEQTRIFVENEMDRVLEELNAQGVSGLIIDIRRNLGGNGTLGLLIANRFAQGRERIAFSERRPRRDGLTDATVQLVGPSSRVSYDGPVAVLTSKLTVSAAESFAQAMRALPHATLIGTATQGALSRAERVLPNGWVVSITAGYIESPSGERFEAQGIPVDIDTPIFSSFDLSLNRDSAIDAAVGQLALSRRTQSP